MRGIGSTHIPSINYNHMKTTFPVSLLLSGLVVLSVRSLAINIEIRSAGKQSMLVWPQTITNFWPEAGDRLDAPDSWQPVDGTSTLQDTNFVVPCVTTGSARFYRLATWDTLFDGTSTSAFRGYQQGSFPGTNQWTVTTNGELLAVANGSPRDLTTVDQYDDFELFWEWRPVSITNGNSGVFYRVGDSGVPAHRSGPEYQLYDDVRGSITDPRGQMGVVYGLIEATNKHLALTGDWSQCRLIVQSNHVQHFLNGYRVLEYDFHTDEWTNAIQNGLSEVAGNFAIGQARSGYIVIQHHGQSVMFRNIRIRKIASP